MSRGHGGHSQSKSDIWTKINAGFTLLVEPIINTFAMAYAIDSFAGLSPAWAGVSVGGLVGGFGASIVIGLGETFAHYKLNSHYQDRHRGRLITQHQEEEGIELKFEEESINSPSSVEFEDDFNGTEESQTEKLTWINYLTLATDLTSHALDVSGPLTIAYNVLGIAAAESRTTEVIVQLGIFLIGAITSIAVTRTCMHNLKMDPTRYEYGLVVGEHKDKYPRADCWTKINVPIEFTVIFINNMIFFGQGWIDSVFDLPPEIGDFSRYGLGFGAVMGFFVAVGTINTHYILNLNHQSKESVMFINRPGLEQNPRLTSFQKYSVFCDKISHTTSRASPYTSILRSIVPKKKWAYFGVMFFGTGMSLPISRAESRRCENNMYLHVAASL